VSYKMQREKINEWNKAWWEK